MFVKPFMEQNLSPIWDYLVCTKQITPDIKLQFFRQWIKVIERKEKRMDIWYEMGRIMVLVDVVFYNDKYEWQSYNY
jgi:hypothetical protein